MAKNTILIENDLAGKSILITGGARRIGRYLALTLASVGASIILHYGYSAEQAEQTRDEIIKLGGQINLIQGDLSNLDTVYDMMDTACKKFGPVFALVNNAAIFEPLVMQNTSLATWQNHLDINLTAPFLLSQAFAKNLGTQHEGRIINLLDWRALRPGPDHFAYTISKAALAALTRSMAISLAPNISVNGLALGAILPPHDSNGSSDSILASVPAQRWAALEEVGQSLLFLLTGPSYITGEIIHLDGGRHLI